jgi:hypothetical protein
MGRGVSVAIWYVLYVCWLRPTMYTMTLVRWVHRISSTFVRLYGDWSLCVGVALTVQLWCLGNGIDQVVMTW